MMDRFTARALVESGRLSLAEYLRLFGEEIRAAREAHRAESAQRRRDQAAHSAQANRQMAGQGLRRSPAQPINRSDGR